MTARFDWYSATFDEHDDRRVAEHLATAVRGVVTFRKGLHGYARGWLIERGKDKLATVLGGSAQGDTHVFTTSESCDQVVPLLRKIWPVHRVSRADSAMDFHGDFDQIRTYSYRFAETRGLKWDSRVNSDGGATFTIGSRSSERFLRVYKKTEQLRAKYPERAGEIQDGIIRAELEFKPSKRPVKERVAAMTAEDLWGLGKWTQDFAKELLGLAPERVKLRFKNATDWDRSIHYLGSQYGPMIARRLETHDPEQVLSEVLEALGLQGFSAELGGGGSVPERVQP